MPLSRISVWILILVGGTSRRKIRKSNKVRFQFCRNLKKKPLVQKINTESAIESYDNLFAMKRKHKRAI